MAHARRSRAGDSRTAVAYLRVSTDDQRLGPEAQRAAIDAWASREGIAIVACYIDRGVSGASAIDARNGLCSALAAVREHGAGILVVAKRDRIARDVVIAATVERSAASAGARLVSADGTGNGDTPADAFMRTMVDGAAAYERGLIRARTKAALAAKKARGERAGTVPYGYRASDDGRLIEDASELAVVRKVRELRSSGLSLRCIVGGACACRSCVEDGPTARSHPGRADRESRGVSVIGSCPFAFGAVRASHGPSSAARKDPRLGCRSGQRASRATAA